MATGRARKDEAKLERRRDILDIAGELFAGTSFQAIAMAQVAERAGLAKGTLYLYFKSKEELFLALLEEELDAWFAAFEAALGRLRFKPTPEALAEVMRQSLEARPSLVRLLGILHAVLEQNVAAERVIAFKQRLLASTQRAGALLEDKLPYLHAGQGAQLILRANALVIGLHQMAAPAPAVAEAMRQDRTLAVFEMDFAQELEATLSALIAGMERQRGHHEQPRPEGKNRTHHGRFERPWG